MPGIVPTALSRLVIDPVDLEGRATAQLATSAVAAQTAALTAGFYDLWATQDTYVLVDTAAAPTNPTLLTGYLIRFGNTVPIIVREGSRINAIAAAAGTLSYIKVA